MFTDFNGDGKTDVFATDGTTAKLWLATGTGFTNVWTSTARTWSEYKFSAGDFTGDGKADLVLIASSGDGRTHEIWPSTGNGFIMTGAAIPNLSGNYGPVVADWNNDGAADLWLQADYGDYQYLFNYVPERIVCVSNGLGTSTIPCGTNASNQVTVSVTYDRINSQDSVKTLADGSRTAALYTKGTGATYPTQDVNGSYYVVSQIDSTNGLVPGGAYSSTYSYQGLKSDLSGRGVLGFSQIMISDLQTSIQQTTNYLTAFPFTGMIYQQTKSCQGGICSSGSGITLSTTTNCYDLSVTTNCHSLTSPTPITLGSGTATRYYVATRQKIVTASDTGSPMPTVTTTYSYDCDVSSNPCYGETLTVGTTTVNANSPSDTSTKILTNTFYTEDIGDWILGRVETSSTTSSASDSPGPLTRNASFMYEPGTGLLMQEVTEPGNADTTLTLTTNTTYDVNGNKTLVAVTGCLIPNLPLKTCDLANYSTRNTSTTYTPVTGEFPQMVTNALGQSENWYYATTDSQSFGKPSSHTGPNNQTTSWVYDAYGRKKMETRPDGTITKYSYTYCSTGMAACPGNAAFYSEADYFAGDGATQNAPSTRTFYDTLSREVAADVQGFNGCWSRQDTQYDSEGHVGQTSRPHFVAAGVTGCTNQPAEWTINTYTWNADGTYLDAYGRVRLVTRPDGGSTSYSYSGVITEVTENRINADGGTTSNTTTTRKNGRGLNVEIDYGNFQKNFYTYDALGELQTTADIAGNTITNTYDQGGRKLTSADPDLGTWNYVYDSFGELYWQQSAVEAAAGESTTLGYDLVGHVTSRTEPDMTSTWMFGNNAALYNVGKLVTATCSGAACPGGGYSRSYTFDSNSRQSTLTLAVGSSSQYTQINYDSSNDSGEGKIASVRDFSGYTKANTYNAIGYLSEITDQATGALDWQINTRDAEMHPTSQTMGNSVAETETFSPYTGRVATIAAGTSNNIANFTYAFDTDGNLVNRVDALAGGGGSGLTENFCYDQNNELSIYTIGGNTDCAGGTNTKTMAYNNTSNYTISSKSDVGSYEYPSSGTAHPHAISSISCLEGCNYLGLSNPQFFYDADGNMQCVTASTSGCDGTAVRSVSYTSFDMTEQATTSGNSLALTYDPEHARVQQCVPNCTSPTTTTLYLNDPVAGVMNELITTGSSYSWNSYLMVDGQIVGEQFAPSSGSASKYYFVLDNLGSVAVTMDSTGSAGTAVRQSYDPWGKMRNWIDGSDNTACNLPGASMFSRGFAGQEQMGKAVPNMCAMVNLNARIYDPQLGRFMSADPTISNVYAYLLLDRYGYVGNDPLSLTDPTGLCFVGCFWHSPTFRLAAAIAVAAVLSETGLPSLELGGLASAQQITNIPLSILNAGISGGASGAISTGKLQGALLGAAQAIAFYGVGSGLHAEGSSSILGSQTADTFVAHGAVGGLFSIGQKGGFSSGFLAAGIGSLADGIDTGDDMVAGIAVHAVAGGIGAVAGGGKFLNGAESGAFGYLFNSAVHYPTPAQQVAAEDEVGPFFRTMGEAALFVFGGEVIDAARVFIWGADEFVGAAEIGRAGEAAVRSAYDIGLKASIDIAGGGTRIPDGLTTTALSEVKNVQSLSYTQQLQDFAAYAQQKGLRFDLYVRSDTQLSSPLQQAIQNGQINLRYIPGK